MLPAYLHQHSHSFPTPLTEHCASSISEPRRAPTSGTSPFSPCSVYFLPIFFFPNCFLEVCSQPTAILEMWHGDPVWVTNKSFIEPWPALLQHSASQTGTAARRRVGTRAANAFEQHLQLPHQLTAAQAQRHGEERGRPTQPALGVGLWTRSAAAGWVWPCMGTAQLVCTDAWLVKLMVKEFPPKQGLTVRLPHRAARRAPCGHTDFLR